MIVVRYLRDLVLVLLIAVVAGGFVGAMFAFQSILIFGN